MNTSPPETSTGRSLLALPLSPSSPWVLSPQQYVARRSVRPQVWTAPTTMMSNDTVVCTRTGVGRGRLDPSPSCPEPFAPQQYAAPDVVSAQVCISPGATSLNLVPPTAIRTGTEDGWFMPLPNATLNALPQQ